MVTFNHYTLTGNPTFTGAGSVGGYITGSNAAVQGTINFNIGTLSGTLIIASNSVLTLIPIQSPPNTFANLILTNYGTINWDFVGCNLIGSSAEIDNYGLWNTQTNATLLPVWFSITTARSANPAALAAKPFWTALTTFNNPGTLDVQVGMIEISAETTT